ncbi:MAG: beta-methylgalactoside transporter [Oscillospiraceae bacterium]|nr:beta-methylgalactoside transporter [Oscillospiraceae bacterium]
MAKTNYFERKKQEYLALDAQDRRLFIKDSLLNNALYILMAIFIIFTAVVNKNFLSPSSLVNIAMLVAVSLPMALGIGGCVVLTGTDSSAGRIFGLAAAMSAAFLQNRAATKLIFEHLPQTSGLWIFAVMLLAMAAGAVIGFVNGFFVAKFSLHPFIVTLATQLITYGIILMFFQINGNGGGPISNVAQEFKNAVSGPAIRLESLNVSIPWYVFFAILLVLIMWFIWNKTRFGKNMFAVGSNMEAAKVSGVNVFLTTVLVHTLAGALYGYAGFVEAARLGSITASTGLNNDSDALAACVIGGVSFVGGTGNIGGIVVGVFVLRIIFVALNMLGINPNLQFIIKGAIILAACSLDMRKYLVKK